MKLLSLFDGSGGFPLAGAMCGITPVAASEVEPFPIRVTTKRFPNMKHLGNISKINGAEIEPVDVITFGSPCQDLSVAGKRKGLNHSELGDEETTRSGLFMEAIRIIKEMKEATNGENPSFAVWENVPGAYSSNKGEDFRIVLEELEKTASGGFVSVPKPPKGKWLNAGEIVGDNYSIAWRTLDAQYWGVPQRRRRIYLVADFRGQRAGKILFEREGLRGDFTQSGTPWQRTAGNAGNGTGAAGRAECYGFPLGFRPENTRLYEECSTTLCNGTRAGFCNGVVMVNRENHADRNIKCLEMTHADEVIRECKGDKRPTLQARMGTGGNQVPLVMEPNTDPVYCYSLDRASYNQGINAQYDIGIDDSGTSHTLVAKGPNDVCYGIGNGQADQSGLSREKVGCLNCMHDQQAVLIETEPHYIVRRLTPLECCRLQGFPDWWCSNLETENPTESDIEFWREVFETHRTVISGTSKPKTDKQIIKWLKDPYSDSTIYKMWGNGIALPNALFVMQGIAEELCREVGENELLRRMENV